MNTSALILMTISVVSIAAITVYYFIKVLFSKKQ